MSPRASGIVASASDKVISRWGLPLRGVVRTAGDVTGPQGDTLFNCLNVRLRRGELQRRPGLVEEISTDLVSAPTGATWYRRADGTRFLVIGQLIRLSSYDGTTVVNRTGGTAPAGVLPNGGFRFASLAFGTPIVNHLVGCNGQVVLQQWNGTDATFINSAGSPPVFRDITAAFDRIVGILGQQVRWGDSLTLSTWSASNARNLGETPGECVAIRRSGVLNLIVWKEDSIWSGIASGVGSSAFAFSFHFKTWADGPAGPNAVVSIRGQAFLWMTLEGRIAFYDGTNLKYLDGTWDIIQDDIGADPTNMAQTWGVYNPENHEVVFYYPRSGATGGSLLGQVTVVLPRPEYGFPFFAVFPGRVLTSVGAGVYAPFATSKLVYVAGNQATMRLFNLSNATFQDDGSNFPLEIDTPLQPTPGTEVYRLASIENFMRRGSGFNTVRIFPLSSDVLDTEGGDVGEFSEDDLTVTPVRAITPFHVTGRYFGWRLRADSNRVVRWLGARMLGRRVE